MVRCARRRTTACRPTNGDYKHGGFHRRKDDPTGIAGAARMRSLPMPREANTPMPSSLEGKIFAQFGANGLVRREIGSRSGKFFLACVQAVRARVGGAGAPASSSPSSRACNVATKKKRVLPMFFFRPMSVGTGPHFRRRSDAGAADTFHRHPGAMPEEKKLHEGVDTLKNRD